MHACSRTTRPRSLWSSLLFAALSLLAGPLSAEPDPVADPATAPCDTTNLLASVLPVEQVNLTGNIKRVTDGAVSHEGAAWDGPTAVILSSGSITYDLGSPRSVSAAYIQADSNDVYRLSGSTDGKPGTYRVLADLENVRRLGHGLRGRTAQFAPTVVRFLRVTEGPGDGAYSIAELSVFCKAPSPFPPRLRLEGPAPAAAPSTPGEASGPPVPIDQDPENPARTPLLVLSGLLLAVGFLASTKKIPFKGRKLSKAQRAAEEVALRSANTE